MVGFHPFFRKSGLSESVGTVFRCFSYPRFGIPVIWSILASVGTFFLGFMYLRFGILLILSVLVSVGTNVTGFLYLRCYLRCCLRCCRGWYIGVRYVGVDAYLCGTSECCRGRRCYSMRCAVILFYGMCGVVLGSCGISVVCPWGEGGSQCAVVGNFPEGGWGD